MEEESGKLLADVPEAGDVEPGKQACAWCVESGIADEQRRKQRLERGDEAHVKIKELLAEAEDMAQTVQDYIAIAEAYRTTSYL